METAKQDGPRDKSLLFLNPSQTLIAWTGEDLKAVLREIDHHVAEGAFVAGYFAYECGEHFVGLQPLPPTSSIPPRPIHGTHPKTPLAWLGVYEAPIEFDHSTGQTHGSIPAPDPACAALNEEATVSSNGLRISPDDYRAALARIHEHLEAGHTYQVNFTDKITGCTDSSPLAVYETLLQQQPVSFAAFVNRAEGPLLSFSPELFFRVQQRRITVRPMKGTWKRGHDLDDDLKAAQSLKHDEKNRSEHVMIVDLLRNDLGRICEYGTVKVDDLFHVETYRTLLQMTSTCSGILRESLSPSQVFANLFPSGSITGAPKRRTMEIIRELEKERRGIYTGSIGYFGPRGEACFNVAIRTVELRNGAVEMGVGGGITAGSKPDEEFEECRLKASFLTHRRPPLALIETMRCESGIDLLPLHMQRLANSAKYFGIRYDETQLRHELANAVSKCGSTESKIRIELDEAGLWRITITPVQHSPWNGRLLLSDQRTHSADVYLRHKTTSREQYEREFAAARLSGFDEVLFLNEKAELTEGAVSNIFIQLGERLLTPALESGVLPGIRRAHLLQTLPNAMPGILNLDQLSKAETAFVCSALRGTRPVSSIEKSDGTILWTSCALVTGTTADQGLPALPAIAS